MSTRLKIQLFGGLQIEENNNQVTGFISNKAAALLVYLAVTSRAHQRDALAALLWGDMAEVDAKNNLRQALANLRKLVGPHLNITRDSVAFDTTVSHFLDTQNFEQQLQRSRQHADEKRFLLLQDAAGLYQGDFLSGFFVRDAPAFEEWMLAQRLRFRELALHALHTLTEHHLSRGEFGRAIDYATRLLALDAWREEAHRQLMLALARSGQRSAALAQEALNIFREIDYPLGEAVAMNNLAVACYVLKEYTESRELLEECLRLCRELGHRHVAAHALGTLGGVLGALGNYRQAWQHTHECLHTSREIGSVSATLFGLLCTAVLLAQQGEKVQAAEVTALVYHHASTNFETKDRAGHLLEKLATELPAHTVEAAQVRGRDASLEEVVTAVLQQIPGFLET